MITIGSAAVLLRTNTWLDPAQSWTVALFTRQGATTPGVGENRQYWAYGDIVAFTDPYIYLGSPLNSNDLLLEIFDGSTTDATSPVTPTANQTRYTAMVYDSVAHTLKWYYNGALIDTLTVDFSTYEFVATDEDIGTSHPNDMAVGYLRQWQAPLTLTQLNAEDGSTVAVEQGSLLSDTPLQASIDLTAHDNTLTQWAPTGTITTLTTDPLVSVIGGPPTNLAANTALAVTPDSVVFENVVVTGAAVDVWFSYTPTSSLVKVASFIAWTDSATYDPNVQVWDNLTDALTGNVALAIQQSLSKRGMQLPVTFGTTYYCRAHKTASPDPAVLQFSVLENLDLTVPAGSFAVNDDEEVLRLPLALMDRTTGYPINFVKDFAQGEGAWIFSTGRLLASNEHLDDTVKLYDATYTLLATTTIPTMPTTGFQSCRISGSESAGRFLVASPNGSNLLRITILDSMATIVDSFDLAATSIFLTAVGVLPDFSKAYVVLSDSVNKPVKCIDLATEAYVSDLDPGIADRGAGRDILCLGPDIILVPYYKAASVIVRKYNAAGTVLATATLDAFAGGADIADVRLCPDLTDATFIAWVKGTTQGHDRFVTIDTATMNVTTQTPELDEYESARIIAAASATPQRFGHSESCPIWVTRSGSSPPPAPTQTYPIRRLRQWLLPSSENNNQMQIPTLELLMRTGIGLTAAAADAAPVQGQDPQVMMQISHDGGKTWSNERWRSAAAMGHYAARVTWLQGTGNYRNAVCRIVVSDPVDWQLVAMIAKRGIREGSS